MTEEIPKSRMLFEEAVDDAQYLVAHAASKCERRIDEETIQTLINAKRLVDDKQEVDAKTEAEFWIAYQDIWEKVKPATADSIKANLPDKKGLSKARRMVNRFIFVSGSVLILLLVFQIYWVIGSQLTTQLADLLQKETELSLEINKNQEEYDAIEIRFKENEMDSETFISSGGVFTFYSSPEWERETLANISAKDRLETDLASLKTRLERNSNILLVWSGPWSWLISESDGEADGESYDQYTSQLASIRRQIDEFKEQLRVDPDGTKKIQETNAQILELQAQLEKLDPEQEANAQQILNLRSQIDSLTTWVNTPGQADQIISQIIQDKERLEAQEAALLSQRLGDQRREKSRKARLAAQFVLVILQSYLLPLLYGILGASTSVLRSLSKEIETVTYAEEALTQHLLRISLGALAGIMVGWFSFLLPNETVTFFGSVSPLAFAFLVGYNIELFFSLMDLAINWVNERRKPSTPIKEVEQAVDSQSDSASSGKKTTSSGESSVSGDAMG